ncbi:hypothetical protein ACFWIW_02535 [Amycolatopsis sp. NPDC058340]|uniref:hypothetical protein n=1 Tax=Amycolatopsis TaxID=1813 RepID=UPI001F0BC4E8|nr:hypothetical protein [Amycolatopsis sp. EV170708-02-1]UMP02650.1 hypothetical protein MJQ72_40910 [Amycolatopsis sp. EV170708-02-1]
MFSIILTWVGSILGLALLVAMAAGAFVVDFDDARGDRRRKKPQVTETKGTPAAPLG